MKVPRRPTTPKKPPKLTHDDLEKYELEGEDIKPAPPGGGEEYTLEGGLRDKDYTGKITGVSQKFNDQLALDKTVFKRNETIHDVTYPGTPDDPGYGAKGDGVTDDAPAFILALAAMSVGDALYIPRGAYKLSDDVTIPALSACIFESGAQVSIDAGKTFTVNGALVADLHLCFSGAGSVDISNAEIFGYQIFPTWFGGNIVSQFDENDATPSVNRGRLFYTGNTAPTTITTFDDGKTGIKITVFFADSNTTVDFTGTNLHGNGGSDWSPSEDDSMICQYDGADWWCTVGGDTAGTVQTYMALVPIDQPDLLAEADIELFYAHADIAPDGATIISCGLNTGDEESTYSVDFQIRATPDDGTPTAVETVATSGSKVAEDDGTLTNTAVGATEYIFAVLPATNVDRVVVWVTYRID